VRLCTSAAADPGLLSAKGIGIAAVEYASAMKSPPAPLFQRGEHERARNRFFFKGGSMKEPEIASFSKGEPNKFPFSGGGHISLERGEKSPIF
jgi:hypothetical protein